MTTTRAAAPSTGCSRTAISWLSTRWRCSRTTQRPREAPCARSRSSRPRRCEYSGDSCLSTSDYVVIICQLLPLHLSLTFMSGVDVRRYTYPCSTVVHSLPDSLFSLISSLTLSNHLLLRLSLFLLPCNYFHRPPSYAVLFSFSSGAIQVLRNAFLP